MKTTRRALLLAALTPLLPKQKPVSSVYSINGKALRKGLEVSFYDVVATAATAGPTLRILSIDYKNKVVKIG